jgi:hypothetical protein
MFVPRTVGLVVSSLSGFVAGIIAGPFLQMKTYYLFDMLLPHSSKYCSGEMMFDGILGPMAQLLVGAVCAPILVLALLLSWFYASRLGARICLWAALVIGAPTASFIVGNLFGMISPHVALGTKHGLLLYLGFPVLCTGVLALRAGLLYRKG